MTIDLDLKYNNQNLYVLYVCDLPENKRIPIAVAKMPLSHQCILRFGAVLRDVCLQTIYPILSVKLIFSIFFLGRLHIVCILFILGRL